MIGQGLCRQKLLWIGPPSALLSELSKDFDFKFADHPASRLNSDNENESVQNRTIGNLVHRQVEEGFLPDLVYAFNPSIDTNYLDFQTIEQPFAAHIIDSHFLFTWQSELALLFDAIVLEVISSAPYFWRNTTSTISWCPPHFPGSAREVRENDPDLDRPYDVAFVGRMSPGGQPHRVQFFEKLRDRLKNRHNIFIGSTPGPVGEIYRQSKIVINYSSRPLWCYWPDPLSPRQHIMGLNGRVFEAMGNGAMLLTDLPADDLQRLFKDGEHFVGYRCHNVDDAVQKIEDYLQHRDERLAIAQAGWQSVQTHHTLQTRAREFAQLLKTIIARGKTSTLSPADKSYFLGRSLLRMALHTMDPPKNYAYLLNSARACFLKVHRSSYDEVASVFVGFVDAIEGREQVAADRWSASLEKERSIVATYFLEALFRKHRQSELADRMADWRDQQPPERRVHPYEEIILRDLLTRVFGYLPRVHQPRGPDQYLRLARQFYQTAAPET